MLRQVSLQSTVALRHDDIAHIVISGLNGATFADQSPNVSYIAPETDMELLCSPFVHGIEFVFPICSEKVLEADILLVFSFNIRNPSEGQSPPLINVSATANQNWIEMTKALAGESRTILGIEGGNIPLLIVEPEFSRHHIGQSSPIALQNNTITLTLQLNLELIQPSNFYITIDGLVVDKIHSHETEPLKGLFSSPQLTGASVVFEFLSNRTWPKDSPIQLSFRITNPSEPGESPILSLKVLSEDFSLHPLALVVPHLPSFGVANGTDPMRIEVPQFSTLHMSQTSIFAGQTNVLTLSLATNVDIMAESNSAITITGLDGALVSCLDDESMPDECVVKVDVSRNSALIGAIFCANTISFSTVSGQATGTFDEATGTLLLAVCQSNLPVVAGGIYQIDFEIVNPDLPQESPDISVLASGTADFVAAAVAKPGPNASIFGLAGGKDPMRVVEATFLEKSIVQSTIMVHAVNTITATLKLNVDLTSDGGNYLSICCLSNSVIEGNSVTVAVTGEQPPQLCKDAAGTDGPGFGSWKPDIFQLDLYVCEGSLVPAEREFVLSFNVTNPGESQESPDVSISASGDLILPPIVMTKPRYDGEPVFGISNVTDVMYVVKPEFFTRSIGQLTPIAGMNNTISLTLTPSFHLNRSDSVDDIVISISGLLGLEFENSSVPLNVEGYDGDMFCEDSISGRGTWWSDGSTMLLSICPSKILESLVPYIISFNLTNPDTAQDSPAVSIEVTGGSNPYGKVSMVKDTSSVGEIEGGAEVLRIIEQDLTTTRITQKSPIGGVENEVSITLISTDLITTADFIITIVNIDILDDFGFGDAISVRTFEDDAEVVAPTFI